MKDDSLQSIGIFSSYRTGPKISSFIYDASINNIMENKEERVKSKYNRHPIVLKRYFH